MRIFICVMEDPLYTASFIKTIIDHRHHDIVGLAVSQSNRMTIGRKRSKLVYLTSLLLIMGGRAFTRNVLKTAAFKLREWFAVRSDRVRSHSIRAYADARGIPTFVVPSVNDPQFLDALRALDVDVVINQANDIVKADLLAIPRIGVINRHNALLPRNRGRLTPFWVAFRQEKETAVSIHFVEEGIDSGDIILQDRYQVEPHDDFNSIVEKNYARAPSAMLRAIERLERGETSFLPNDDASATYNTIPRLSEALQYRLQRLRA